ncbi:MAG: hypothetical protein NT136_02310 [Candidatus Moranbacteria bacterium]|nr:hypothetical protein [Candidatus Moranbacteria bacterium]
MVTIAGYNFDGPYKIGKIKIDRAAIYVILNVIYSVIDVGQSGETGTRLLTHERKPCWDKHGGYSVAVKWMPTDKYSLEDRLKIEKDIRNKKNPPCGIK